MTAPIRAPGHAAQILLVEDSPDDARLTQEAIRETNAAHEVTTVTDGDQALAFLHRYPPYGNAQRPDLILLDLNLPKKNGRQVLIEIKSDADLRRIPVLILSTSGAPADVLGAYDAHANAYLRKPVGFAELANAIAAMDAFWFNTITLQPAQEGPSTQ